MNPTSNQDFFSYQPPNNDYKYIIKCILAAPIIMSGFLSIVFFDSPLSGFMRVIAGLILFPPTLEAFEKATKIKLNRIVKYVIILVLFQASILISLMSIMSEKEKKEAEKPPLTDTGKLVSKLPTQTTSDSIESKPDSLLSDQQLADRADQRLETNKRKLAEFQDKYISGWDGSFRPLEQYVKENMNDPDSFEHVQTDFWGQGDYVLVAMKFRGNNSFGAKVVNVVKAKVSWDGQLIDIIKDDD